MTLNILNYKSAGSSPDPMIFMNVGSGSGGDIVDIGDVRASNIGRLSTTRLNIEQPFGQPLSSTGIAGSGQQLEICITAKSNVPAIDADQVAKEQAESAFNDSVKSVVELLDNLLAEKPPEFGKEIDALAMSITKDHSSSDNIDSWALKLAKDAVKAGD